MQSRWEQYLTRAEAEAPRIRHASSTGTAGQQSAYDPYDATSTQSSTGTSRYDTGGGGVTRAPGYTPQQY